MRGSFSARRDGLPLKAPTLRSAPVSAAEKSAVDRRSAGAAVVNGRLRASAARAAVYHLARERCSAVVLSDSWSELLGETVGARSIMLPSISSLELSGRQSGAVLLPISVDKFGLERRYAGQGSRCPAQVFAPIGFWCQAVDGFEDPRELRGALDSHLIPDLGNGYVGQQQKMTGTRDSTPIDLIRQQGSAPTLPFAPQAAFRQAAMPCQRRNPQRPVQPLLDRLHDSVRQQMIVLVLLGKAGRVRQRSDDLAQQQQRSVPIERISNLADVVLRQFCGMFEQGDQMRLPRQVHAVVEGKGRQYLPEGRPEGR